MIFKSVSQRPDLILPISAFSSEVEGPLTSVDLTTKNLFSPLLSHLMSLAFYLLFLCQQGTSAGLVLVAFT